jgi:AraC-like DNA-binding protein
MGRLSGNALEVRVLWADHHVWPAGQQYNKPCYGHALWLMLEGEAEVWSGEQCWRVAPGDMFLWPKDLVRNVITPQGANWLSIGLEATCLGQADILRLLPLPALHLVEPAERAFVQSWLQHIVELRRQIQATPENQRVAKYFESVDQVAALPSHAQWVNQIVAQRASHYDVIEESLARAVVAWCWALLAPIDLENVLHHESPQWLQQTLERIHKQPTVSVHELARATGFSPAQFRRSFHQKMGQAPREYLQRQRINVARHLLETTDLPIAAVAAQLGFASVPHFVQLWKRSSGLSPLQYRLSRKETNI